MFSLRSVQLLVLPHKRHTRKAIAVFGDKSWASVSTNPPPAATKAENKIIIDWETSVWFFSCLAETQIDLYRASGFASIPKFRSSCASRLRRARGPTWGIRRSLLGVIPEPSYTSICQTLPRAWIGSQSLSSRDNVAIA